VPRLQLFDLAVQAKDDKQAEARVREIAGLDEQFGRYCRAELLAWRARTATGPDAATMKEKARAEARGLLDDLKVSRPDWSKVPLALARLDEEEAAEAGPGERRREKLESAINSSRLAIELGLRDPVIVRHLVDLLFQAGRGSEALEVYSQAPAVAQLPGSLERVLSQVREHRDFRQAEEIARKAVAANPRDFQARLWLARVLIEDRQADEAETVLRDAVAAGQDDPDRWANLVVFLIQSRRLDKAGQAIDQAEAHIARAPLVVARCCENLGTAYNAVEPEQAKAWYGRARRWFGEAQKALKDPGDLSVKRRLVEFLIRTNQAGQAEGPLKEILERTPDGRSPDAAWARRLLAQVYALGDPPRIADALALIADKAGQPGGDPADLRVLSVVHAAQRTPEGRRQAIADLEALAGRDLAAPDDLRRLAQLLEADGRWEPARDRFRELIRRTEGARDMETLAQRPLFITLFFDALIRHHKPGDDSDLAEAGQLAERLKPSNPLAAVVMEAEIDKAAKRPEEAAKRIRQFADRPDLTATGRLRVAEAAERLGLFDAAEAVYRRLAAEPADPAAMPNWARLAAYLARRGKVKDAIDLCDAHWADPRQRQQVAAVYMGIVVDPGLPVDKDQIRRVMRRLEEARQQELEKPRAYTIALGLGNLCERLHEYSEAEKWYRDAIALGDSQGIAANNLAWLISLMGNRGDEALALINKAITARGAYPEYLDTRGMVRLAMGEGQLAVPDLEKALSAAPSPPKYFHLARAYLALNDKAKARRALEAGKSRGLPRGLHDLELAPYKEMTDKLGEP
jgi:cellulose synthase operon protein C